MTICREFDQFTHVLQNHVKRAMKMTICREFHQFMERFEFGKDKNKGLQSNTHTFYGPPWSAFYIPYEEYSNFVDHCTRACYASVELYFMERPNGASPFCADVDLKFKESTTRGYTNRHIESTNNIVRGDQT